MSGQDVRERNPKSSLGKIANSLCHKELATELPYKKAFKCNILIRLAHKLAHKQFQYQFIEVCYECLSILYFQKG